MQPNGGLTVCYLLHWHGNVQSRFTVALPHTAKMRIRLLLLLTFISFPRTPVAAQILRTLLGGASDPAYITELARDLTVRSFIANKALSYAVGVDRERINYAPNDRYNLGVGFTYKWISLNVSFPLPGRRRETDQYGSSSLLDLSSNIYLRKITIDLQAQRNTGYYRSDMGAAPNINGLLVYPQRPDMVTMALGASVQYLYNHRRFSYRAPFVQNELQRKSAGSLIVGGAVNHHIIDADSSIIDRSEDWVVANRVEPFDRVSNWSLSAQVGYAHTFVYRNHWFATAALAAGPGIALTTFQSARSQEDPVTKVGTTIGNSVRLAIGYNARNYFLGLYGVLFQSRLQSSFNDARLIQVLQANHVRIVVAIRFSANKKFVKTLEQSVPTLPLPDGK